jgi:RNA polymerase sigma factor (sigma-70 family)
VAVGMRPNPSAALVGPAEAASLFERYSARIHAYCLHVLGDRGEAEDAVQTTFLNAHRALQRGVRPEHEYAWLHTIAKNVCRTAQRTRGRRAPVAADVDVDSIPGNEEVDNAEELRTMLAGALAELPESQRRAVVLREWHGLTPVEIADRLGLSVPATYALLTRARRSLVSTLTATVRGPLSVLNLGALGDLLRSAKLLLGSAGSKAAVAAAVATISVGVGGAVVERSPAETPARMVSRPTAVGVSSFPVRDTASTAHAPQAGLAAQPQSRGGTPVAGARRAAPARTRPVSSGPVDVPQTTPRSTPTAAPAQPTTTERSGKASASSPAESKAPLAGLGLPGVPPLLPDLESGDLPPVELPPAELPPVELSGEAPPLPVVPEVSVEVDVQPPPLPLP